jgi:hypothetical protein
MFLQNTDLNIVPGGIIPVMHVSQYDVGRELKFVLYDGYDTADITTGTTVTIEGTKPDGHGFQYSGVLDQNAHTATFVTTEQMTVLAGAIECKLTLYLNSQRIGTALFILDVEKAGINDSTIISDTELPLIIAQATEQMERAEAAADAAALSETNAATSETNAATSETNAANSEIICGSFMRMAGASAASAEQSAIISGSFMRTAGNYADEAEASAASANVDALKSEGHAIGKQNGVPVTSESPYYHNNAEYWAGIAEQYAQGGLIYKGSILFANIPVSGMHTGDLYNIEDDFTTDSRFEEGAGISVRAGADIAWNGSKWDVLATGGGGHTILDEDGVTYPQRSKLQFEGCEVTDDAVNGITVVKCEGGGAKKYAKPTITVGTYTYDGTTQAPTITGFDANVMTLTGTYEAINAGSYTFTIALSDKTSSKWTDDTQDDIVTNWSIDAISVAVPTVTGTTKTYNGSAQSPTITRDTANTSISGTTSATKVKSNYSFSIALTDTTNHKWSDNTTAAKSYTWKINPPTGSSYTPVNNIQAWLQCASIDKTYTTIAQVLADATTLSALMLSNNAVDYLVRSTSWVSNITGNQTAMTDIGASDYCANKLLANSTWRTAICDSTYFESVLNAKVPVMTSNTTPYGKVIYSSGYAAAASPWYAFDNDMSTSWQAYQGYTDNYIGYNFTNSVCVNKVNFVAYNSTSTLITTTFSIQGSNDGNKWDTLGTTGEITPSYTDQSHEYSYIINNNTAYLYYRIFTPDIILVYGQKSIRFKELQFYGRASS